MILSDVLSPIIRESKEVEQDELDGVPSEDDPFTANPRDEEAVLAGLEDKIKWVEQQHKDLEKLWRKKNSQIPGGIFVGMAYMNDEPALFEKYPKDKWVLLRMLDGKPWMVFPITSNPVKLKQLHSSIKRMWRYMDLEKTLRQRKTYLTQKIKKKKADERIAAGKVRGTVSSTDYATMSQKARFQINDHMSVVNPYHISQPGHPKYAGPLAGYDWAGVNAPTKHLYVELESILERHGRGHFQDVYAGTILVNGKPQTELVMMAADGKLIWSTSTDKLGIVGYNKKTYDASSFPRWSKDNPEDREKMYANVFNIIGRYPPPKETHVTP